MYYNSNDDLYLREMTMSCHDARNVQINEQQQLANEKRLALMEAADRSNDKAKRLSSFLVESKNMLITEAIYKLVKDSLPSTVSESLLSIAKNITANFVVEEGAESLLNRFKTKTCFLSEMANIITELRIILLNLQRKLSRMISLLRIQILKLFIQDLNNLIMIR